MPLVTTPPITHVWNTESKCASDCTCDDCLQNGDYDCCNTDACSCNACKEKRDRERSYYEVGQRKQREEEQCQSTPLEKKEEEPMKTLNQQPLGLPQWDFENQVATVEPQPQQQKRYDAVSSVVVTNANRPEGGIGLPVWNFEKREESKPVASVSNVSGEKPLGLPIWQF